jgi:hypothetical protein
VTPYEQAEIEAVARALDTHSLRRSAARLRALLGTPADPERICPVQDRGNRPRSIPWELAEILYPAYGHDQSLERLAERGGFGWRELGLLSVDDYHQDRPRLARPPLLDLYEMAVARG